jgi:uncharacterized Fe-S cluster protein YjdI
MALEYTGAKVMIGYDPDVCTHSGNCVNGLPAVFDVDKDPWINPDAASVEEIKGAIRNCPSGALTMKEL